MAIRQGSQPSSSLPEAALTNIIYLINCCGPDPNVNNGIAAISKTSFNPLGAFTGVTNGDGLTGEATRISCKSNTREARSRAVWTVVSSVLQFLLLSSGNAPALALPPTGLTVIAAGETEISLSWTPPVGEVDAYNIFR